MQETLLKGFQFGTLTVDGYELLTYFSILRGETGLMYLWFTIYSVFLMHVEIAKRAVGFESQQPVRSAVEERRYYVGTDGFGKIMCLHLRRGPDWRRRSPCFRGTSGPICKENVEKAAVALTRGQTGRTCAQDQADAAHCDQNGYRLSADGRDRCAEPGTHSRSLAALYSSRAAYRWRRRLHTGRDWR